LHRCMDDLGGHVAASGKTQAHRAPVRVEGDPERGARTKRDILKPAWQKGAIRCMGPVDRWVDALGEVFRGSRQI
jgi:hypothetical protein